jgi:hypothetical protein
VVVVSDLDAAAVGVADKSARDHGVGSTRSCVTTSMPRARPRIAAKDAASASKAISSGSSPTLARADSKKTRITVPTRSGSCEPASGSAPRSSS